MKEKFPFSKEFIARFSTENPHVLENYKKFYAQIEGAEGTLKHTDFDEEFDEVLFAKTLIDSLADIVPGRESADEYHKFTCLSMKLSKAAETQRMSHRGFQSLCHIRVRTVQLPPTSL